MVKWDLALLHSYTVQLSDGAEAPTANLLSTWFFTMCDRHAVGVMILASSIGLLQLKDDKGSDTWWAKLRSSRDSHFLDPNATISQPFAIDLKDVDLKSLQTRLSHADGSVIPAEVGSAEPHMFREWVPKVRECAPLEDVRCEMSQAAPTMEEIEAAAKLANAHDFIMSLPEVRGAECGTARYQQTSCTGFHGLRLVWVFVRNAMKVSVVYRNENVTLFHGMWQWQ